MAAAVTRMAPRTGGTIAPRGRGPGRRRVLPHATRPKEHAFTIDGTVVDALPNAQFRVRLDNGHELLTYLSGKVRRFRIRVVLGDRVRVELTPYDLSRGRISYRYR